MTNIKFVNLFSKKILLKQPSIRLKIPSEKYVNPYIDFKELL